MFDFVRKSNFFTCYYILRTLVRSQESTISDFLRAEMSTHCVDYRLLSHLYEWSRYCSILLIHWTGPKAIMNLFEKGDSPKKSYTMAKITLERTRLRGPKVVNHSSMNSTSWLTDCQAERWWRINDYTIYCELSSNGVVFVFTIRWEFYTWD